MDEKIKHSKERMSSVHLQEKSSATSQFYVGGMACAFCASTIEKGLKQVEGVDSSKVLMESGEVFIRHDPSKINKPQLKRELQRLGYYIFEGRENMSNTILADSRSRALKTWVFAAASILIIFPVMFPVVLSSLLTLPSYYGILATVANFAIATIALFYFAMPIHRGTIVALRKRILNEHVLYGVAGFGAYVLGVIGFVIPIFRPFFFIAVLLTGLHLTAGWLGARLRFNVEMSVRKLMDLRPPMARVLRNSSIEEEIPVSDVKIGDTVVVKPGERVPLDGVVTKGKSEVAEAILTGESAPVAKNVGDQLIGGSTNGSGVLILKVTSDFGSSYISRIIGLVRSAKETRSTILSFFDKIVDRIWVPLVLLIAGLTLTGWTILGFMLGNPGYWETGVICALLVAVIGYPCAIGFSSPSVGLSVFSEYANNGILIKDATMFERLKDVKTVIFDKTGTLTYGSPRVVQTIAFVGMNVTTLLRYAASVENESTHPIARAIVKEADKSGIPLIKCENFDQVTGEGARGSVDGKEVIVGRREFLESKRFLKSEIDDVISNNVKSPVLVGLEGHIIGAFDVKDSLRPEAREVVQRLKSMDLEVVMVTGDTKNTAEEISQELGGIDFLAKQTPEDKIKTVKEFKDKSRRKERRRGKVLMVGDGLNDAAALTTSDVAVATAASIDVSKDVADAVLVSSNNLRGILAMIENSRSAARASAGNIILALSFNAVGIPLAVLGILSASFAMSIMLLSLFGVFANAYLTKFRLRGRLFRMIQSQENHGGQALRYLQSQDMTSHTENRGKLVGEL